MLRNILILIFAMAASGGFAQQFSNLRARKEAEKVIISYDITTGKEGQTFDVRLECSVDRGITFTVFPEFVSGDVNAVSTGTGKQISWDVLRETQKISLSLLTFQLAAIPNTPTESVLSDNTPAESADTTSDTFTDLRDGHVYQWIKIGTQTWMAENLAFLPEVSSVREGSQSKQYFYVYDYNGVITNDAKTSDNYNTYGVLYNWAAAVKACPAGWHLPGDAEWQQLEIALGMTPEQAGSTGTRGADFGNRLKTTEGWQKQGNGSDASNFSALPAGGRYGDGNFGNMGCNTVWWSASGLNNSMAWGRGLGCGNSEIYKGVNYKESGFSVRCVKD